MSTIEQDYSKAVRVVHSCKTSLHLLYAREYIRLFRHKWKLSIDDSKVDFLRQWERHISIKYSL